MCHSEFTWQPNSRVNFVTGANGSGKSSVMQGISLGLLGETKSTKRFAKVSEFIKKDESRAVIQVTLRNMGEEAYKPLPPWNTRPFQGNTVFDLEAKGSGREREAAYNLAIYALNGH